MEGKELERRRGLKRGGGRMRQGVRESQAEDTMNGVNSLGNGPRRQALRKNQVGEIMTGLGNGLEAA